MKDQNFISQVSDRESFLLNLLNKVVKEYKSLLEITRGKKPLKIVEIVNISATPGETEFIIQITNKNCILKISAAQIMHDGYKLTDFSEYHAELIRQAAQGKLTDFLKFDEKHVPLYKVMSKVLDRDSKQYVFTLETKEGSRFTRTAAELTMSREILRHLSIDDIYDIGYTQGCESILREEIELRVLKNKRNTNE
jgi:hypothetical protein